MVQVCMRLQCDDTSVCMSDGTMCVGGRNVMLLVLVCGVTSDDVKHWIVAQSITIILCVAMLFSPSL